MNTNNSGERSSFGSFLRDIILIAVVIGIWYGVRMESDIRCTKAEDYRREESGSCYTEQERMNKAIALSYLVYGCEGCEDPEGTVDELLSEKEMGIIRENFGILRTNQEDPGTAKLDTAEYIRKQAGSMSFLAEEKNSKSGFYGAAFCDDSAKCIWIAYAGSVTTRDAVACGEFVLAPGKSQQERSAFTLYEYVMNSDQVQQEGYQVIMTGHSLGGAYAAEVALASGWDAETINGADGIAVDKYNMIEGELKCAHNIVNHMTKVEKKDYSMMAWVQRLMYLGGYKEVTYHLYSQNDFTADPHCVFSFLQE